MPHRTTKTHEHKHLFIRIHYLQIHTSISTSSSVSSESIFLGRPPLPRPCACCCSTCCCCCCASIRACCFWWCTVSACSTTCVCAYVRVRVLCFVFPSGLAASGGAPSALAAQPVCAFVCVCVCVCVCARVYDALCFHQGLMLLVVQRQCSVSAFSTARAYFCLCVCL